jgi:hypothetical protein
VKTPTLLCDITQRKHPRGQSINEREIHEPDLAFGRISDQSTRSAVLGRSLDPDGPTHVVGVQLAVLPISRGREKHNPPGGSAAHETGRALGKKPALKREGPHDARWMTRLGIGGTLSECSLRGRTPDVLPPSGSNSKLW